ncbi:MAG TPA: hypothetical protein DCM86_11810 [Verrucomicrobiales bacterium]|nr:hypothetical protein [Verrucomicrobiales bacterium]
MQPPSPSREQCAALLQESASRTSTRTAFIGLDGFVDEIIRVVDQRQNDASYTAIGTIHGLGTRIESAAGKSTNIELVVERTKIGGNGPIMASSLARLGARVTYVGALGHPNLHPVFADFARIAEVHSIAEPGHSDALEFKDGKIILGKLESLREIHWANIQERFGRERFIERFASSDLVGLVNWTMLPQMSAIWNSLLTEVCPKLSGPRRRIFFDLADPQKRTHDDIRSALALISRFQGHFDVILGLNEKEAYEIGEVMGIGAGSESREALVAMSTRIQERLAIDTLVVHPVSYALAVSRGAVSIADGPYVPNPRITTGAGDHFNAGFCLGKLLGLDNGNSLLTGVSTSGFYVKEARSPGIDDLVGLLRNWPSRA